MLSKHWFVLIGYLKILKNKQSRCTSCQPPSQISLIFFKKIFGVKCSRCSCLQDRMKQMVWISDDLFASPPSLRVWWWQYLKFTYLKFKKIHPQSPWEKKNKALVQVFIFLWQGNVLFHRPASHGASSAETDLHRPRRWKIKQLALQVHQTRNSSQMVRVVPL